MYNQITDVPGVKVGNKENHQALTGCTAVIFENGAVAGVDVRGSAPGTRETDLLNPINLVDKVHAITLSGGSAFGLDSASGVMQFLEEKGIGLDVGVARVPIVPAAVLFDLPVGDPKIRPDRRMGYEAAKVATTGKFSTGNYGAGCGATVGKLAGLEFCMKGGLGSASICLENGVVIGAIVAVNPVGDVREPATGEILAGVYKDERIIDSLEILAKNYQPAISPGSNTTIGVIAVNADLTKAEATKVAQMAHDGYARTIFPAHTMFDGDTIFAVATGGERVSIDVIGGLAAKVMESAIIDAVKSAESVGGIIAHKDLFSHPKA
ncbi:P1 family peptidase [Neobacillus sp. OS1-32]|jgi:L-aminopeptidase/D-esterase-like protein|uniref:P1 family peptidase n=1 Tax=Neobacillus sp. OS1-32 TaxID=3070682 RepID=UPI0027DFE78C|nr:P1 family peptidase [Neobacillus sp. OS1-32]WML31697.1 P1 family peptidase [Neobacillus sp. OS1-32]